MHSGSYKETGGMYFASVGPYKALVNSFVGAEQNKVTSTPIKKQMNAFTVSILKDDCSEEKIQNLKQVSFLESGINNTDRLIAKLMEKRHYQDQLKQRNNNKKLLAQLLAEESDKDIDSDSDTATD